jgi:rod shape-determining protein MreD
LVATVTLALFTNRRGAGIVGFFAGVLQGAMAGANLGAYAISRTLAGFLTGWFNGLDFDGSPTVAALCTVIVTALAQVVFMFVAPTPDIGRFLLATMGMAVYNGVLAIPLYAALRCVLAPPAR